MNTAPAPVLPLHGVKMTLSEGAPPDRPPISATGDRSGAGPYFPPPEGWSAAVAGLHPSIATAYLELLNAVVDEATLVLVNDAPLGWQRLHDGLDGRFAKRVSVAFNSTLRAMILARSWPAPVSKFAQTTLPPSGAIFAVDSGVFVEAYGFVADTKIEGYCVVLDYERANTPRTVKIAVPASAWKAPIKFLGNYPEKSEDIYRVAQSFLSGTPARFLSLVYLEIVARAFYARLAPDGQRRFRQERFLATLLELPVERRSVLDV